ncbi:MAG: hypothetical protein ABL907_08795 [Hyphomicrobium sp.]
MTLRLVERPLGALDNILARLIGGLLALGTLLTATAAFSIEVEFKSRAIRRDILALYDGRAEANPTVSRLHRLAEMPLNWLGFKLEYRDVNKPLPSGADIDRYRGIVTWFVEPMANAAAYLEWLNGATAGGLRLVALSDIAPSDKPGSDAEAAKIFERLGLNFTDQYVSVTHTSAPLTVDPEMVGFERPLDKALPAFPVLQPASAATRVHLSLSVPDQESARSSAVIATSPGGGFVADGFTIFYDAAADRARWIVNPFLFFKKAFGEERFPVPDVTTLAGRRMYFSHIDGDGWNNISEIEGYRETQTTAADVIRTEVIEPYPDLPVSAGLIAGDAMPDLGGLKGAEESATRIFALPQVEVASHTYTHPFAWGFFENYDRQAELNLIDRVTRPQPSLMDRMRGFLYRVAGKAEITDTRTRYIAGSADLPRGYLKDPFDVDTEIGKALQVSESFAPKGKKAAIYLWSGDTEPFEAAVRAVRLAGARNMNGGDTRLDAEYPSVFYVPPIARPVGAERQIYAGNSNENTYTNNWHGPYYGQLLLTETLKNTEAPRRLKPFNLYYHMYSGEKPGSLNALKHILDLARREPVIPVKASEYAAIADDFFAAEIAQVDAMTWSIAKRGALQTFRFDEAASLDIDWARSSGVIGANRANGALYVALDPQVPAATIAVHNTARETNADKANVDAAGLNGAARLVDSRWQIAGVTAVSPCGFIFSAHGYGAGDMVWQAAPQRVYDMTVKRSGALIETRPVTADDTGRLAFTIAADAIVPLELGFSCHAP